jgi:RecB family exonuclease
VITERRTRLHRAPSLPAFRAVLTALVPVDDLAAARSTAVLVPSRTAADLLRRTLEDRRIHTTGALVFPDLVTRRDWYERLHTLGRFDSRLLTAFEREVIVEAAAHEAITEGDIPPFNLRPALVGEIVALYDLVRRQQRSVEDFERVLAGNFDDSASYDRGAERLLGQTRFLSRVFRGYERRRDDHGGLDEHRLRDLLLSSDVATYRRAIVTIADRPADADGLWAADFDLLSRLPGLEMLDVISTEEQLATGWLERVHGLLPGLEEVRPVPPEVPLDTPVLVVPDAESRAVHFESRDREEELADLVRRIRALDRGGSARPLSRIAVVCGRPLPYAYLAPGTFESGGVPLQSRDALPLAAEPFAAALDLVFSAVSTLFSASPLTALLRSPHLTLAGALPRPSPADLAALDVGLSAFDHGGSAARLDELADGWAAGTLQPPRSPRWQSEGAARAARVAAATVRALEALAVRQRASASLEALLSFLHGAAAPLAIDDPLRERHLRARRAVLSILDGLREAHARHHDLLWTVDELAATVRRWIEAETFTPSRGRAGVVLTDAASARYGEFTDIHLVGLVDGEWPVRARRNVFYSQPLLAQLGGPPDLDRTPADRAAFVDLLQSPSTRVSLAAFALEDDALVDRSPLLDAVPRAGLTSVPFEVSSRAVFTREALATRPVPADAVHGEAARWLACREQRPDFRAPEFHGRALPSTPRSWSVSSLEQYALCPFKYYARYVLKLAEEWPEEEGLTPLERGRLIHEVFETFYAEWQARGHRTVSADQLDAARALAATILDRSVAALPPSDQTIERTRFLGSPVAPGLIDVVLRMEAERETPVIERWLEHRLDGTVRLRGQGGEREIALRGIADRVDLLGDGTFRVVDYKSSRATSPLQLAMYATALRQQLADYRGRRWILDEAAYIAFREEPPVRPLSRPPADVDAVIAREEAHVVEIVDAIARGEFPPRPAQRSLCATCAWATVCRKDYVEAEVDAAAPAV